MNNLMCRRAIIMSSKKDYIVFVDPEVERIAIAHFSSDGIGVTKQEAARVTSISNYFKENSTIISFDELEFFTQLTYIYGSSANTRGAFYGDTNLTSVTLPDSVRTIQQQAFMGCSSLSSINLSNLTKIDVNAFRNCSSLQIDLNLPNLTSIELGAFSACGITKVLSLGTITALAGSSTNTSNIFYNCTNLTEVTLPSTLTTIGQRVFRGCSSLTTVNFPSGITSIGEMAFYGTSISGELNFPSLTSLGHISFFNTRINKILSLGSITTILGGGATTAGTFKNCTSLTEVILPSTLTTLEEQAFRGCTSLTTINLPSSITSIGANCFNSCPIDIDVNLPNIATIGDSAFLGTSIKSVTLGGTITSIAGIDTGSSGVFRGCNYIKTVDLPSTITSIGYHAFRYCHSLETFVIRSTTPPTIQNSTFGDTNNTFKIYVPNGYGATYQSASIWSNFSSRIYELDVNGNIPT